METRWRPRHDGSRDSSSSRCRSRGPVEETAKGEVSWSLSWLPNRHRPRLLPRRTISHEESSGNGKCDVLTQLRRRARAVLVLSGDDMVFAGPVRLLFGWKGPGEAGQRRAFS